jgi:DNA repair protein RadC
MYESQTVSPPELIRDLPPVVRPISRLASLGAEALKDHELIALVLHSRSLKSVEDLLAQHSLKDLLGLSFQRLSSLRGVGYAGAAALLAAAEVTRRTDKPSDAGFPLIQSVSDAAAQAIEIRDKKKEYLLAFFLNARHQLIAKEVISIGTLTASLAHPREVFAPAIGKAAAGVILVHNHPSGDPSPSDEDVRLTKRIAQAGQIMGIELLDHLIVAQSGCHSFKQAGGLV